MRWWSAARFLAVFRPLFVDEGQDVKAGQLIAIIENEDLQASHKAAEANAASQKGKLGGSVETERQDRGETSSATVNAEALLKAARASLAQAQANYDHQLADTSRTVALAKQGIMSEQANDDAATSLQATKAAVDAARENVSAAEASLRQARAHELLTNVAARTVDSTRNDVENARALAEQAKVQLGYAQVFAPVSGKVNVRAARQGEVVAAGAAIVTIMDLTQTWIYAPLPETQADAVSLGDCSQSSCPPAQPSRASSSTRPPQADFATQRDVAPASATSKPFSSNCSSTIPETAFVPGMTAEEHV